MCEERGGRRGPPGEWICVGFNGLLWVEREFGICSTSLLTLCQAETQCFLTSCYTTLAWRPNASVSSRLICSGIWVWARSHSDRFPIDLFWSGPITTVYVYGYICQFFYHSALCHTFHCSAGLCLSNASRGILALWESKMNIWEFSD